MTHRTPEPGNDDDLVDNLPSGDRSDDRDSADGADEGVEDRPREDDDVGSDVESP